MKRLILATGINREYETKAQEYLESLEGEANVECVVITLDYHADEAFKERFPRLDWRHLSGGLVKSPNSNQCLQHGGFLHAMEDVESDDVIVFTDADIVLQRPFHQEELDRFRSLESGQVMVGYNRGSEQTLADEAELLGLTCGADQLESLVGGVSMMKVYNTGVMICKASTYRELYDRYHDCWPELSPLFTHYARQQWILSYLLQKCFEPVLLDDAIHSHGHHPLELRLSGTIYGKLFCIDRMPVALSHAICNTEREEHRAKLEGLGVSLLKQRKEMRFWRLVFVIACLWAATATIWIIWHSFFI